MAKDAYNNLVFPGATSVGLRNVGSYQVSGHPYITGSTMVQNEEKKISFPYVSKKVTVIASGSQPDLGLRVHFAPTGSTDPGGTGVVDGLHYIVLGSHEDSIELDVKCKEVYVSSPGGTGGFMLYASLTNIPTARMYAVTGSGITDGPGD